MADAIRGFWQQVVSTKRLYLNPHEHFGRANICRAALASYARNLRALQASERGNVLNDALARTGH
ncbi:unnamed protein product [Nippostrongylus brasiliensis]|uniref:Transposase n=1 Tax=Nippostrongylus brasiliensis TaxID=27835 RepID=A0A0N4Y1L9_NIPBR|nr:unnamed protein product [Nippostrongylus brasiliensis]